MENQDNETVDLSNTFKKTDENTGWGAIKYYQDPNTPKLIQYTMRFSGGLVSNEKQAGYILLGLSGILIIAALLIVFNSGTKIEERNIYNPETAAPDIGEF